MKEIIAFGYSDPVSENKKKGHLYLNFKKFDCNERVSSMLIKKEKKMSNCYLKMKRAVWG
jgi:hypothetical protein